MQAQAALQAEAQRPRGQAERLVLGDGVEEGARVRLRDGEEADALALGVTLTRSKMLQPISMVDHG